MPVEHQEEQTRFVIDVEGEEAELAYVLPGPRIMDIQHTYVPEGARGHGLAEELAQAAFDYAREKKWKVVPTCPFIRTWLRAHPDEAALVDVRYASVIVAGK
ncbi:MAG TPA: GNAT family N-acetyltransferase [Gemmatimonadaceae bacterium]|nr:GNAT family N-acetyltransferase [Gemmatimonadaceae bacterium]